MKRSRKKKLDLRRTARWHAASSLGVFFAYLGLSFLYSPDFLLSDVRSRYRALAEGMVTVTGRVLGPPAVPIVSGVASCRNGVLSVSLSWAEDEASESFDIVRDGLPLVSGLSDPTYSDTTVSVGSSYVYAVVAHGPMGPGVAVSESVAVTLPSECAVDMPVLNLRLTSFDGKNVSDPSRTSKTSHERPTFIGTVNIPNARISILVGGPTIVSAETSANVNGYFVWRPPFGLENGLHTLSLTATDPEDYERSVSFAFSFRVTDDGDTPREDVKYAITSVSLTDNESGGSRLPEPDSESNPDICRPDVSIPPSPIRYSLSTETGEALQGGDMVAVLSIRALDREYEGRTAVVRYVIVDDKGQKQSTFLAEEILVSGGVIRRAVPVSGRLPEGRYTLRTELLLGQHAVVHDVPFSVRLFPFLNLGGGYFISYPDALHHIGTLAFSLMVLLFLWIGLFFREYGLFLGADRFVSARHLAQAGFFGPRKGVDRK
ncbi:MAG: hypothetical protein HGB18_05130 [Candidatus Moranbacteria bacterium]|nr:hypothetical protein [Candidatus Moranbacteria bacterium]